MNLIAAMADAHDRWIWSPMVSAFEVAIGLRWWRNRQRARRDALGWDLVVRLEDTGLSDSAGLLAGHLADG